MLLRLIAENLFSFKDATEFNTFPSSKSKCHDNHKIKCGHATVLRMSAIYGANGAGKSNLIKVVNLLQAMVQTESLQDVRFYNGLEFKLDTNNQKIPSGIAIEFFYNKKVFYYHIEFVGQEIVNEELYLCKKNKDEQLFSRNGSELIINTPFGGKKTNEQFNDAIKRLLRRDMLLLSFLGSHYSNESPVIADAYKWLTIKLHCVIPDSKYGAIPHLLDTNPDFKKLIDTLLPDLKTGVDKIDVKKKELREDDIKDPELMEVFRRAKANPHTLQSFYIDDNIFNVTIENGKVIVKQLVAIHKTIDGNIVEFSLVDESDGTRRLIDYIPLLFDIINSDSVYVVDEIERSLHPIMIKDIIRKISESQSAKGQLIFTTHESCLLDQSIFRPDEIWFAQKDVEQATQLYPLSDFNIHKTANIENGYLDGRYGGIPFLSNLKDLHW